MTDIFKRALLTSDPVILQKFKGDVIFTPRNELSVFVQNLLADEKQQPAFMNISPI